MIIPKFRRSFDIFGKKIKIFDHVRTWLIYFIAQKNTVVLNATIHGLVDCVNPWIFENNKIYDSSAPPCGGGSTGWWGWGLSEKKELKS